MSRPTSGRSQRGPLRPPPMNVPTAPAPTRRASPPTMASIAAAQSIVPSYTATVPVVSLSPRPVSPTRQSTLPRPVSPTRQPTLARPVSPTRQPSGPPTALAPFDYLDDFAVLDIAYRNDHESIFNLCQTNSRFNQVVCQDPYFWGNKAVYDGLLTEDEKSRILSEVLSSLGTTDTMDASTQEAIRDKFYRVYFNKLGARLDSKGFPPKLTSKDMDARTRNLRDVGVRLADLIQENAPMWKFFMLEGISIPYHVNFFPTAHVYEGKMYKYFTPLLIGFIFDIPNVKRRNAVFSVYAKLFREEIVKQGYSLASLIDWFTEHSSDDHFLKIVKAFAKEFGHLLPLDTDNRWALALSRFFWKFTDDEVLEVLELMLPYASPVHRDDELVARLERANRVKIAERVRNAFNAPPYVEPDDDFSDQE